MQTPDNHSAEKSRYLAAPRAADFTIDQDWASYSAAEHDRWDRLFARAEVTLENRACDEFVNAMHKLQLSDGGIPDLDKLSARLMPLTGWRVVPVRELVPDEIFFDHLANRRFPAGAFIRPEHELDYLQEPDIFHDVFGHVPLLANPVYADFMEAYGKGGQRALKLGQLKNLARLYCTRSSSAWCEPMQACASSARVSCRRSRKRCSRSITPRPTGSPSTSSG